MSSVDLARGVFSAIDAQDEAALERLIHPDAVLEMAMARGRPVRGREDVLAALREAWKGVHSLSIDELETLTEAAVIIRGRSRYPLEQGGFADSSIVWLCQYRDGMLWRQRLFSGIEDARAGWDAGLDQESGEGS